MSGLSTAIGAAAEEEAEMMLTAAGYRFIAKIHTGWKIVRWVNRAKHTAVVVPAERVAGDFRAIDPGTGRSVLVEVKARKAKKLSLSWFKPHQRQALDEHNSLGGASMIIWVAPHGTYLLPWPVPGLAKGSPIGMMAASEWSTYSW